MRSAALAALALLTLAPAALAGDPAFPFEVHQRTLDNGFKAYAVPLDSPGVVAYWTVVRTGARNEVEEGRSGFAHFFEHMMFRGTERYSADAYNDVLKAMGADSNAWTWNDQTVYHITAGAEGLAKIVDVEADRFQNLKYEEPEFQKEARAVLGEYNKSASNPRLRISEVLRDLAYDTHTYQHTTMGFLRDIEAMPTGFEYAQTFFDRYYRPDNVVVICAGDVDPASLFALIEQHYGAWTSGPERPAVPVEPPQTAEHRQQITWDKPTLPRLDIGWHVPAFTTRSVDHAALEVLAAVVFAERSPLYRELVIEAQKVATLSASNPSNVDPALFHVSAHVNDAADLQAVEDAIHAEIARVAAEGVDARTLDEVKSNLRYGFAAELSTASGVASTAAWFVSLTGDISSIDAWYQRLDEVTPADVARVASTYFTAENRNVVTLVAEVK